MDELLKALSEEMLRLVKAQITSEQQAARILHLAEAHAWLVAPSNAHGGSTKVAN